MVDVGTKQSTQLFRTARGIDGPTAPYLLLTAGANGRNITSAWMTDRKGTNLGVETSGHHALFQASR